MRKQKAFGIPCPKICSYRPISTLDLSKPCKTLPYPSDFNDTLLAHASLHSHSTPYTIINE